MKRKICVMTGTRADYGLLLPLLKLLKNNPEVELQIIASAMHLSPEYGLTYKNIETDGFTISAKVEMLLSSNKKTGVAKSLGLGVIEFSNAFEHLKPDIVVILGDRFEALACAETCLILQIPIAHIHGGEITEGLIDEAIRHSVTKMSHLHFVTNETHRNRVIQLGEDPGTVFNFGAPGLDTILSLNLLSKIELEKELNMKFKNRNFLVTYHPETLNNESPRKQMEEVLKSVDTFTDANIFITMPNSDPNSQEIRDAINAYSRLHSDRVFTFVNLGSLKYLSLMKHCDLVIGNSSSGIIEAPFLKVPTINIGMRQKGRAAGKSVIHCDCKQEKIIHSINEALSPRFKEITKNSESIYGAGQASSKIIEVLIKHELKDILYKKFHDIGEQ